MSGPRPLRVLHLVGSPGTRFYAELSKLYARDALEPPGTESRFLEVCPGGALRVGEQLGALAPPRPWAEVLPTLADVDLVVPHMFCVPGMTSYRAFFEGVLGIPVVGSPAAVTSLAADKFRTRLVAAAAGLRIAPGALVAPGEVPPLDPPFVVKPNREDNSLGVTLVGDATETRSALARARAYDEEVLVEGFVPGREIRVAVIERDDGLHVPPMIEYEISESHPIRTRADKLDLGVHGAPTGQSARPEAKPVCPAPLHGALAEELGDAALRAHRAMRARDYSLFDFRVHAESGQPFLLEAGLFWSFSPISMISRMLRAEGADLEAVVGNLWRRASRRRGAAHRVSHGRERKQRCA